MRNKILSLLVLLVGTTVSLLAQPTINIGDGSACTGETFCIPVTAEDFTNINSLDFDISYDPAVLTFTGANSLHPMLVAAPGNLSPALFVVNTPGTIEFGEWNTGVCSNPGNTGVTIDDDEVIFELCFQAAGIYGQQSSVAIANAPTPRCTRNATQCNNIGVLRTDGNVTLCVREFNLTAQNASGNEGDLVCVDFVATGWDVMAGIQFSVNYDPAFLQFQSLNPNSEIPNNTLQAYGVPGNGAVQPGNITVAWSFPPGQQLVTVDDNTTMFTACFTIIGACEQGTEITFSGSPTSIEVTNEDPDNPSPDSEVPFSLTPGIVLVNDCNPTGVELIIDCGDVANINDVIEVQVLAGSNFDAVRRLEYLMRWNPNILEFVDVTDPNNLVGLDAGDFDTGNIGNGFLGLAWSSNLLDNLDPNELIYTVRFRVIGLGGDSPIQILTPGIGVSMNVDIGVNPSNCVVEVNQPASPAIAFGQVAFPLNGQDCIPVTVTNFTDVLSMEFTLAWDETLFASVGVQNINPLLTGASAGNFTPLGPGALIFDWESAAPVTVPNGTVLFELCYTTAPAAAPGDMSEVFTVALPVDSRVVTSTSNGDNVGLVVTNGELEVLFPEGFGLSAEEISGGWLDTICMNFTVESFDNITGADFTIAWNPTELVLVDATPLAWTGLTLTPQPVGIVRGTTAATPPTIPDGEVAFELCFQLIGDPNDCYDVTISDQYTVSTSNGPGSIVITNGEICVEERIVIDEILITPTSCPGICDGNVQITVREWSGQGFIGTVWHTEPFEQFTPLMLANVCEGELSFTVFDNQSGVSLTDTIVINAANENPAPVILGDEVQTLSCNTGQVLLRSEDMPGNFSYAWYLNTVPSTLLGSNPDIFGQNTGRYILCVRDLLTTCVGYDTVTVTAPVYPEAVIDQNFGTITCNNGEVEITGMATGDNLSIRWEIVSGGAIDSTTINSNTLRVLAPGAYRFIARNTINGCEAADIATVSDGRIFPDACLDGVSGPDAIGEQFCDGTPTPFDASCSNNAGLNVSYAWFDEQGNPVGTGLTNGFNELGLYTLVVTEQTTGCVDTAFATVAPNSAAPSVTIAEANPFTCNSDVVAMQANITPVNPSFQIQWTSLDGGTIQAGTENNAQALALTPGQYRVLVLNPDNSCEASADVAVENQTIPPTVAITNAPESLNVTCLQPDVILDGCSSEQGANITYQWYLGNEIITGENDCSLSVSEAGMYTLRVFNVATGCVDSMMVAVTEDTNTPTLSLSNVQDELTCEVDLITVTATITNSDDVDFLGWSTIDEGGNPTDVGNIVSFSTDSLTITVDEAGIYRIRIMDMSSGCPIDQDLLVTVNREIPTASVADNSLTYNCASETVNLSGLGSSTGANITYLWENIDANGPAPVSPDAIQTDVNGPGEYMLTVRNIQNGCVSDTLIMVAADTIRPIATIAPIEDITCAVGGRQATVMVENAPNFSVSWANTSGGANPMPATGATVTVNATGTYQATITNSDNACQSTAEVTVGGDTTPPALALATLPAFDCADESLMIDATATGAAADFTSITWTTVSGTGAVTPATGSLQVSVDNVGEYRLEVVSAANGCVNDTLITIGQVANLNLPRISLAGIVADLGCDGTAVTIDASASDPVVNVMWTSLTPGNPITTTANPLIVNVTQVGTYRVTAQGAGALGCDVSLDIPVSPDENTPVALAGADQTVGCGETGALDATASTPPSATFVYEWVTLEGTLSGDVNGPTPSVVGAGQFQLIIRNVENGCVDTSSVVTVTLQLPAAAQAGADMAVCETIAELSAIAVPGTTGVWTTSSGAAIEVDTDPATGVSNLVAGANTFTWTLSAEGCPDYSSDQVTLTRATTPTANNDILVLEVGVREGQVRVVENDLLGGSAGFNLSVLTPPGFGIFDSTTLVQDGNLVFRVTPAEVGVTEMSYVLCSTTCPTLCDTAVVAINVMRGEEIFVPNTITPNGDGANDEFIFDILLFDLDPASNFPDNELIVFNRWGDIIFQAKPYNNDWTGLNMQGKEVPEGTYYYVLRLNLGEGEIVRGDITIIR